MWETLAIQGTTLSPEYMFAKYISAKGFVSTYMAGDGQTSPKKISGLE